MGLQHSDVTTAMQTGYPSWNQEPEMIGFDDLGNEIYSGDIVYELDDHVFVVEELGFDSKLILEKLGADREIAK